MRVITFYSYKGGVGRTLACANFGLYLAKTGQKVVLADMDFEAPGLDSKFSRDATTNISNGLLDQITAFQEGTALPNLSPISIPLSEEVTRSGGRLQLIPAGNYFAPDKYYEALSNLNWKSLLKTEEGLAFWFDLMARIENQLQPDVLVIDSRTGITEIGGLCTQVLPDTVLLFTSTSSESLQGTRRIHERIKNSRLIQERRGPNAAIDLRVILTRVPRQPDPEAFDRKIKLRLNLEIPHLYYLFADGELATDEYLAMDRFVGKADSILSDYVELFASLNPEDAVEYIEERLGLFRKGLTLRKEADSRQVIQELLTLFPRSEVYLEAARYYRLVKEPEESIQNYLRYLQGASTHRAILAEFAEVCALAPQATVSEYRDAVVKHFTTLGPSSMESQVLSLYCTLVSSPEHFESIVKAIEAEPTKLAAASYRGVLFRSLNELQQWDRVIASATDLDLEDAAIQRVLAKAYAKLHAPEKALQIIHKMPLRDVAGMLPILEILYEMRADVDKNEIRKVIRENRYLSPYIHRYSAGLMEHPSFSRREDGEFRSWVRDLLVEKKVGQ